MKGHIAFCPHFHQPHFQLYRTREEAFKNSYHPWMQLLAQAVTLDSFYINLHLSGPFLYWVRDTKSEYLEEFHTLLNSGKIGLLGGLADEPFIQLSSRSDDYLYQLQQYDHLLSNVTGVKADDWQGIHLVERECGELLLYRVAQAARMLGTVPIFYLDAETYYTSHFSYPGSENDYCLTHFGFKDPFSKTTISHLPQSLLYFGLRDEIGGEEYFSFPVHSQYRYQLLKRNSFTGEDNVRIKPKHYYFYIKDALEKAYEGSCRLGRPIEPLLVIFEDAEKFGQWSKDPYGDLEWLMEFFTLVDRDPQLDFTGLKDYLQKHGFLDTYPASTSHSYPEWENWTARRGIRGVTFGDERLRRVICRLRDLERLQDRFESVLLKQTSDHPADTAIADILQRAVMASPERYNLVDLVLKRDYPQWLKIYNLVNRVRHLVYQEDPKWASRHPSYGSSPFYDMQGMAYLEIAIRAVGTMLTQLNQDDWAGMSSCDWDMDGESEILVENNHHTVVLDKTGGCLSYQHVLAPSFNGELDEISSLLEHDFKKIRPYNHIHKLSYPLVMTESDSDLSQIFYYEGGRREVTRNSMRCSIICKNKEQQIAVGEFDTRCYDIEQVIHEGGITRVVMHTDCSLELSGRDPVSISMIKEFIIGDDQLQVTFRAAMDRDVEGLQFVMVPELVTSAAPSDEKNFKPCALIGVKTAAGSVPVSLRVRDMSDIGDGDINFTTYEKSVQGIGELDYLYRMDSADGSSYVNQICYQVLANSELTETEFRPAVGSYYRDYVFEGQSRLGYHTSGLMVRPQVSFQNREALFSVRLTWNFDVEGDTGSYEEMLPLIEGSVV